MIARLVLVEVVRAWRLWASAFVIMVLAAVVALVCAGDVSTAAVLTDPVDAAGLRNHALVFGGINSIVVVGALNVLVTFTIRVQRRTHALWQFGGIGPALIGRVVLTQAAALSLAAFGTALLVIPVVLQQLMAFLSAPLRSVDAPALEPRLGLVEGLAAFAVFELTVLLSALGAARAASRTPALFAVREPELEVTRTGLGRKTTAVVLGVTTVSMYVLNLLGAQGVTMMFLVPAMGFVVTVAPWLCRTLVAWWTTALPEAPASWFLARESLTHHVARSHSAIALLAVALMLGSLTGLAGVWDSPSYYLAGLAIFGSPVLIILFTGAATVVMTTMGRRRDVALLVVAGGTFRTAVVSAVLEAFAMVVTAVLIALPVALATVPTALSSWTEPLRPLPFVMAIGFVIMLVATVNPVLQARRRSLGRLLVDTGT
ncbi:hypothetical protein [Curtobacterium aurantiacum]|uniref:hypothetical protein n=1 Tax=Curtobacterium aurantiacum TaxID=3236919 RepID=UPI001BDF5E99|nr:hypothetical protein [Curtobacterium flaccumfaciens]MBT1678945.1 hypothetical protein [Curtobacterium flaccumfaciens pv. flaccumfaciens]